MFEIIVAIIIIVCVIYFFKEEVFGRSTVVTIVESLPLSIFKKNDKVEESKLEKENVIEDRSIDNSKINEEKNTLLHNEDEKYIENIKNNNDSEDRESQKIDENINLEVDKSEEELEEERLVYWTPNGKTYHNTNTCRTLSRSKVINSGNVIESGKDFECEHCK